MDTYFTDKRFSVLSDLQPGAGAPQAGGRLRRSQRRTNNRTFGAILADDLEARLVRNSILDLEAPAAGVQLADLPALVNIGDIRPDALFLLFGAGKPVENPALFQENYRRLCKEAAARYPGLDICALLPPDLANTDNQALRAQMAAAAQEAGLLPLDLGVFSVPLQLNPASEEGQEKLALMAVRLLVGTEQSHSLDCPQHDFIEVESDDRRFRICRSCYFVEDLSPHPEEPAVKDFVPAEPEVPAPVEEAEPVRAEASAEAAPDLIYFNPDNPGYIPIAPGDLEYRERKQKTLQPASQPAEEPALSPFPSPEEAPNVVPEDSESQEPAEQPESQGILPQERTFQPEKPLILPWETSPEPAAAEEAEPVAFTVETDATEYDIDPQKPIASDEPEEPAADEPEAAQADPVFMEVEEEPAAEPVQIETVQPEETAGSRLLRRLRPRSQTLQEEAPVEAPAEKPVRKAEPATAESRPLSSLHTAPSAIRPGSQAAGSQRPHLFLHKEDTEAPIQLELKDDGVQVIGNGLNQHLEVEELVIGRHPICTIVMEGGFISRRQARLANTASGWVLEDLHSTNGTELNGRELEAGEIVPLSKGDQIRMGGFAFEII